MPMTSLKPEASTTRTKILVEASRLFKERGYYGASTREIAAAVGVRQQSLRHHFPTKQAILEELLCYTVTEPLRIAQNMQQSTGSPAVRLYAYVQFDVAHLHNAPYALQGLFGTYLLGEPGLVKWYQCASDIYDAVTAMVVEGIAAEEFREINPDFAAAAVGALVEQTINAFEQYGDSPDVPSLVADFVLSGLLRDPSRMGPIRERAGMVDPTERPLSIDSLG